VHQYAGQSAQLRGEQGSKLRDGSLAQAMADVIHAHHTAAIVPTARLVIYEELGHFSIEPKIVPTISELLDNRV
jgi:hypothetical protein